MVIQRWQSVYLLLAIFAMILVFIRPFGTVADQTQETLVERITPDYPVFLIVNILITLLLLIDIFLFRNLKVQRLVAAVCILLILASAATAFLIIKGSGELWEIAWTGAPVGLVCALICTVIARYRMGQDEKLLKSYDRLR